MSLMSDIVVSAQVSELSEVPAGCGEMSRERSRERSRVWEWSVGGKVVRYAHIYR